MSSGNTLIIQKYITNLILFNSRKFDVRTYMLAVTINGSTKFYWHDEGYLRTSSYIFNLKNCTNVFVHLTNDAIQS
jgi:tubulin polyglutamylase TTLL1/tubulin monoglycylase TTLL3/8